MAGLVPAIHVFGTEKKGVDARVKPGHDEWMERAGYFIESAGSMNFFTTKLL
jgi:hypothetical protein